MTKQDAILNQIETLLEALCAIITDLEQDHTYLVEHDQFIEAGQIKIKINELQTFHTKVKALYQTWSKITLPITPTKLRQKTLANQKPPHALQPGLGTPKSAFHLPILQALVHLDGSAPLQIVLDRVHEIMKNRLNEFDYQSLPSGPHAVRWENNAKWARFQLVKEGFLAHDSPWGIWKITDEGRRLVAEANPELGKDKDESEYQSKPFDFEGEENG